MLKLLFSAVVVMVLCGSMAAPTWSFPKESCGEKSCVDCHTLGKEEARYLLGKQADRVLSVQPSEVQAMWVVEVEQKGKRFPVYIDFTKNYVLRGELVRLQDGENLTRERTAKLNRIDVSSIPLDDALILGKPDAPTKVIVFTDPQCSFCKKLHGEMQKVVKRDPDIVFYIKMLPLTIHPNAYMIAKSIVCNRSLELLEASFANRPVPPPLCRAEAVDRNIAQSHDLGFNSTPTLVLPDGRHFSGYRTAPALLKLLGSKITLPGSEGPDK